MSDDLKRFDRKNSAFARSQSDPASVAYGKCGPTEEEVIASGKPGSGRADFALRVGARTADVILRKAWRGDQPAPTGEPYQPEDWSAFTQELKQAAGLYGASLVGVTRVNPLWLYAVGEGEEEALPAGVDTAVVMAVEMNYDVLSGSPTARASAASHMGYSQMAMVASNLAAYLRYLGYRAIPSGNDIALSVALAVDAGLGELGRNGMLITKEFGPRVRLCKVFTDAPLTCDGPVDFGAAKHCETCTLCADACPPKAIPAGEQTMAGPTPSNNSGLTKWYQNADKCLAYWEVIGTNCSNCIKACPYSRSPSAKD